MRRRGRPAGENPRRGKRVKLFGTRFWTPWRHVDDHGARPLSSRHGPSCPTRRTSGCWYTKGQSHHDRQGGRGSSRRRSGMHIVTACACGLRCVAMPKDVECFALLASSHHDMFACSLKERRSVALAYRRPSGSSSSPISATKVASSSLSWPTAARSS